VAEKSNGLTIYRTSDYTRNLSYTTYYNTYEPLSVKFSKDGSMVAIGGASGSQS